VFEVNVFDIICGLNDHPITASLDELNQCKVELAEAWQDVIRLHKRLIRLFDETHQSSKPVSTRNGSVLQ